MNNKKQKEKEIAKKIKRNVGMVKDVLDKIFVEEHLIKNQNKPKTLKFFRVVERKNSKEFELERIIETKYPRLCSNLIEVSTWHEHYTSLWIKIRMHNSTIILDSGVIESLAKEIKKLKKFVLEEKNEWR